MAEDADASALDTIVTTDFAGSPELFNVLKDKLARPQETPANTIVEVIEVS
jgi:hypothetical protein